MNTITIGSLIEKIRVEEKKYQEKSWQRESVLSKCFMTLRKIGGSQILLS